MRCQKRVVITVLRKVSVSRRLQRSHLGHLHKVWSFLDLGIQLRSLSLPDPLQLFMAEIASHIERAIWPISPIDHSTMMASSSAILMD